MDDGSSQVSLAMALIAAYGLGAILLGLAFPGSSDDLLGAHVDLFYGGNALLLLVVLAITSNWSLVGRDRITAMRWIVVVFVWYSS